LSGHPDGGPVPVTFISPYAAIGGAELYLQSLLEGLGPEWIRDVIVLEEGRFPEQLRERGFPVRVIAAPSRRKGILSGALHLRRELLRNSPSVIHANQVKAALISVLASRGTGVPVIWNKVDSALDGRRARLIALGCDQVIGISRSTVETFSGATRSKIHLVYPGLPEYRIDRESGRAFVEDILGPVGDSQVIVLSGGLCPQKGQLDLIEVAPEILRRMPRTRFALLGGETRGYEGFEEVLRRRVAELDLESVVAFLGHRSRRISSVEDAVRFVSGCNVLVAPSRTDERSGWKEGFGLAAVEAMRVGTPVVAYRHGSLPEVLGDCAVMAQEGDRDGLRHAVMAVLDDPWRAKQLSDCGRARSERYRLSDAVAKMRARYLASAGSSRNAVSSSG
jgi:glycosyltransferase involved in cell wall biosynthesis